MVVGRIYILKIILFIACQNTLIDPKDIMFLVHKMPIFSKRFSFFAALI